MSLLERLAGYSEFLFIAIQINDKSNQFYNKIIYFCNALWQKTIVDWANIGWSYHRPLCNLHRIGKLIEFRWRSFRAREQSCGERSEEAHRMSELAEGNWNISIFWSAFKKFLYFPARWRYLHTVAFRSTRLRLPGSWIQWIQLTCSPYCKRSELGRHTAGLFPSQILGLEPEAQSTRFLYGNFWMWNQFLNIWVIFTLTLRPSLAPSPLGRASSLFRTEKLVSKFALVVGRRPVTEKL